MGPALRIATQAGAGLGAALGITLGLALGSGGCQEGEEIAKIIRVAAPSL